MPRACLYLFFSLLLASCAGEFPTSTATNPSPVLASVSPRSVESESGTRAPAIRQSTLPATFTATYTPTITLTPTITPTASPISEADLCAGFEITILNVPQRGVLFQFRIPQRVNALLEVVHHESATVIVSQTFIGGKPQFALLPTSEFQQVGDYDWTMSLFDAERPRMCEQEGSITVEEIIRPTLPPVSESTPEAESTVSSEATPEATSESDG